MEVAKNTPSHSRKRSRRECDGIRLEELLVPEQEEEEKQVSDGGSKQVRPITVSLSDPDVLTCSICFDSLTIPLYECDDGHIACSACCIIHDKKCITCPSPLNRSRALEKILQSIKVPCPNSKYGCKETLCYNLKNSHEPNCIYAPCSCPHSNCNFVASSKELSLHFSDKHGNSAVKFTYDKSFYVTLKPNNDGTIILQEETQGTLFILHNNVVSSVGNVVNISWIGPKSSSNTRFQYIIWPRIGEYHMAFLSFAKNIQCESTTIATLSSTSLVLPFNFFGCSEPLKLEIEIIVDLLAEDIMQ